MTEKVKEFKKELTGTEQPSQSSSSSDNFTESKINLLRYGGFELHSMLLKRGMSLKSTKPIQKRKLNY